MNRNPLDFFFIYGLLLLWRTDQANQVSWYSEYPLFLLVLEFYIPRRILLRCQHASLAARLVCYKSVRLLGYRGTKDKSCGGQRQKNNPHHVALRRDSPC